MRSITTPTSSGWSFWQVVVPLKFPPGETTLVSTTQLEVMMRPEGMEVQSPPFATSKKQSATGSAGNIGEGGKEPGPRGNVNPDQRVGGKGDTLSPSILCGDGKRGLEVAAVGAHVVGLLPLADGERKEELGVDRGVKCRQLGLCGLDTVLHHRRRRNGVDQIKHELEGLQRRTRQPVGRVHRRIPPDRLRHTLLGRSPRPRVDPTRRH